MTPDRIVSLHPAVAVCGGELVALGIACPDCREAALSGQVVEHLPGAYEGHGIAAAVRVASIGPQHAEQRLCVQRNKIRQVRG